MRSKTGPSTLIVLTSLLMVSGWKSLARAVSTVSKEQLPAPWPTSKMIPRLLASRSSSTTSRCALATPPHCLNACVTTSPGRRCVVRVSRGVSLSPTWIITMPPKDSAASIPRLRASSLSSIATTSLDNPTLTPRTMSRFNRPAAAVSPTSAQRMSTNSPIFDEMIPIVDMFSRA